MESRLAAAAAAAAVAVIDPLLDLRAKVVLLPGTYVFLVLLQNYCRSYPYTCPCIN